MTLNNPALLMTVSNPGEAHIIRGLLESNGIPCAVFDDHPAGIGLGVQNIRIIVETQNLEQARQIISEAESL